MRPVYLPKPQQQLTQLIAMYQKHKKIPLLQLSCPVQRHEVPWGMRSPTIYGIHNWPTLQGPQCPTVQVWLYDCPAGWLYLGKGARKELCRCLYTWTHSYKTTECWTEFKSLQYVINCEHVCNQEPISTTKWRQGASNSWETWLLWLVHCCSTLSCAVGRSLAPLRGAYGLLVRLTEWLGQFKTWVQTLPAHITILRSHEKCVMYAVSKINS